MSVKLARWSFLLLAATLPLVRIFEFRIGPYPASITDFLFVAVAIFWCAGVARREVDVRTDKFFLFVAGYGAVLALSAVNSTDPSKSVIKLAGEIYLFCLAFISFQLLSETGFRKPFIKAWLAGTLVTVLAAFYGAGLFYSGFKTQADNSLLSHFGSLPAGNYPRLRSVFANANMAANYLNVSLMLTLAAGALGYFKKPVQRLLQGGVWMTALATLSPGLGGIILGAGLWYRRNLLLDARRVASAAVLSVTLLLAGAFVLSTLVSADTPNTDRQMTVFGKTIEPSVRVLVWESALGAVVEHPLLGLGVGVDPASVRYETISGDRQFLRDAHNIPLNVAGQSGLIGLAAFSLMIVYLVKMMRAYGATDHLRYALSLAFLGAVLYQGLTGSFEDARHIWILIGFILAVNRD